MENEEKNILIIGPPDSGKETAMKSIDIGDSNIMSASYGMAIINDQKNYLFSFKGEEIFKSLEEILSSFGNGQITDGIIILLDNSMDFRETDNEIVDIVISKNIPYVVFSNKQDLGNKSLNANFKDSLVIPTIATEGIGVQDGFRLLLKLIEQKEQHLKVKKSVYKYRKVYNTKKMQNKFKAPAEKLEKLRDIMTHSDTPDICKLRMSMHPIELEKMVKTLENRGFSNMTVVENWYVDDQNASMETYRGSQYDVNLKMKVEVTMILRKDDIRYVLNAIKSIKSDDIDDHVIITPIERVLRVRTHEEGEEAID